MASYTNHNGTNEFSTVLPSMCVPYKREHSILTSPAELLQNYRKDPLDRPPEYPFGYPKDVKKLGPLDNAAQGRAEYSHEEGYRGIRPVVDAFSITKLSLGEWNRHNENLLRRSEIEQNKCKESEWHSAECIEHVAIQTDTTQAANTENIWKRQKEIHRFEVQLYDAISKMVDEIDLLKSERTRLRNSLQMVLIPISIARESLHRRTSRIDTELVRDEVEDALTTEMALTTRIQELLEQTLRDLDLQMIANISAQRQMQYDWAEKVRAYELEEINGGLRNQSTDILFKHGSTIFPNDQSTVELWHKFVVKIYEKAAETRHASENFRKTLDAILIHAARDLRTQADKVECVILDRIRFTEEITRQLQMELKKVMQKLADADAMFPKLKQSMRKLDFPMKVAQTRLSYKSIRPKVENCRDISQYGLINEVKLINDSVSELRSNFNQIEQNHTSLLSLRGDLERDILLKQKSVDIDRSIYNDIRSRFPSANELTGYFTTT